MSGFLQNSYSSGEGDFLHRAAHKEPELPCISSTRGCLCSGLAREARQQHWRVPEGYMEKGEPPSSLQHSAASQGSARVPAQALAACSPAGTAALQERREMRAPCLRRGHLMLAAPEIAWKPLF